MNVIGFHNPDEEYGYLSNWYLSDFYVDNIKFSSMEQYMMYTKAMVFKDDETAGKIMMTDDVAMIKKLGRQVQNYNDHIWNGIREIVVYKGLTAKFNDNERLGNMLVDTGDALLAECAVNDRIWGIGLSMNDPDRLDLTRWRGTNLLGYSLMIVRNELIKSEL